MNFMLDVNIVPPSRKIDYKDHILLVGSCFTEHIGTAMEELKFQVLENPNGILFDPRSVAHSLQSYIDNKKYSQKDLFQLNELWHSWEHHTRFSHTDKEQGLDLINKSQATAHEFLRKTTWIIITLGTAFSYRLTNVASGENGQPVANCHRAPSQWFQKYLMTIQEITSVMASTLEALFRFIPNVQIILTVSPVRHIREGVVENNKSKARLIECVHELKARYDQVHYFPAYELVIDVLRDYRFFDVDLVHPNYQATEYVFEKFSGTFFTDEAKEIMGEIKKISISRKHKPFQPSTQAHKNFLQSQQLRVEQLKKKYPFLSLEDELAYFSKSSTV